MTGRLFFTAALAVLVGAGTLLAAPPPPGPAEGRVTGKVAEFFHQLRTETGPSRARVRLITDNVKAWYARWMVLSQAEETIDLTYFIVDPDIFGKSMMGLLLKKAREGVRIRFMLDARGSKHVVSRLHDQGLLQALQKFENVTVKVFNPWHKAFLRLPRDVRALLASNHDKIILVDDEWVITGGRNIGWHYFADPAIRPEARRDADVVLRGREIAAETRLAFEEEFASLKNKEIGAAWFGDNEADTRELELARRVMERWISGRGLTDPARLGSKPHAEALARLNEEVSIHTSMQDYAVFRRDIWQGRREYPVKLLDKHSFRDPRNDITENMVRLFDEAEDYIMLQNPYVVPTKPVVEALMRAGERGVRVILHTNSPKSTNQIITQAYFLRDWKRLLRDIPTMRIFVFTGEQVLHSKVIVVDDQVASVGTYNLDPMSESINSEMMALIESSSFARRLRHRIEDDIEKSVEYRIEIDENGVPRTLCGPEEYLEGQAARLVKLFKFLKFLRPLV